MREQILKLIETNPKGYVSVVKNNDLLFNWVKANSLVENDKLAAMIYSALYNETNICEYGNLKKFTRISTGFSGCGPASTCKCTAEQISKNVSKTKSAYTESDRKCQNDKRKTTMIKKYGVEFNSQREDIKFIWTKSKLNDNASHLLNDREWLHEEYNVKKKSLVEIADDLSVYYGTVAEYCRKYEFAVRRRANYSLEEVKLSKLLTEYGIAHEIGNWSLLDSMEIDIYIPEKKLAIEINGLYWHSWNPKQKKPEYKNRHIEKTEKLKEQGISLIHITDYELNYKSDIIKNILRSKLGINKKIYARNCSIGVVDKVAEKQFLNQYHLQGYNASTYAYGLYYDNELVQIITLGKPRFNKKYDFEVLRFCTKSDITVVGGLGKLTSMIKTLHRNNKIITYCDASKSSANGYIKTGFNMLYHSSPGYFWTDGNAPISRYKCQKKQLEKWLAGFDKNLSESDNMFNSGYRRYWDCGNIVLELNT